MTRDNAADGPRRSKRVAGIAAEKEEVTGADGCSPSALKKTAARNRPFRFFDLPSEIRNKVYGNLADRTNEPNPLLAQVIIRYSYRIDAANLAIEQSHIQWMFNTLAHIPEIGPEFMANFYETTIIDFDFDDFEDPLYGHVTHTETGAYIFPAPVRMAQARIAEVLVRFRHFKFSIGRHDFVRNTAADVFEDAADRVMLPRTSGTPTISIDIGQILGINPSALSSQMKLVDICNVIVKIQRASTARLDLHKTSTFRPSDGAQVSAADAQLYVTNMHIVEAALGFVGVDLSNVSVHA